MKQNGYYLENHNDKPIFKVVGRVASGLILLERLQGQFDDRFDFYSDESFYALIVLGGYNLVYYDDIYKSYQPTKEIDWFLRNELK